MDTSPTIQHLHGRLFTQTITTPAAGIDFTHTIPARRRWTLRALRFRFITDANVANRRLRILLDDGTNNFATIIAPSATVATSDVFFSLAPNFPVQDIINNNFLLPLPSLALASGSHIKSSISAIQAGDQLSAIYLLVEEWIDP